MALTRSAKTVLKTKANRSTRQSSLGQNGKSSKSAVFATNSNAMVPLRHSTRLSTQVSSSSVQSPKTVKQSQKGNKPSVLANSVPKPKRVRRSHVLRAIARKSSKPKPKNPLPQPPNVNKKQRVNVSRNLLLRPQLSVKPPPTPSAPNHVNKMPEEMLVLIFNFVGKVKQIGLRRVCKLWMTVIESHIAGSVQYVKLNLHRGTPADKTSSICATFNPASSIRGMQFEGVWDEPTNVSPHQSIQFTVPKITFNQQMAKYFGRLFQQLKTLVIYYDLKVSRSNIQNLVHLMSGCSNVESFSLIMSSRITADRTLPWICETINQHFGLLKRLDLFVPDDDTYGNEYPKKYDFHPSVELSRNKWLTHMGLSCSPANFYSIILNTGTGHESDRETSLVSKSHDNYAELSSLSIQCRMLKQDIVRMFNTNRELSHVRRLQLSSISNREMVGNFLNRFTNVENLQLYYYRPLWDNFDKEWVPILAKLPKLTELTLFDFALGTDMPQTRNYQLPNVKKLTFAVTDLLTKLQREYLKFDMVNMTKFGNTIHYLFPGLEEIVILAGEDDTFPRSLELMGKDMADMFEKMYKKVKKVHIDFTIAAMNHIKQRNPLQIRQLINLRRHGRPLS